jgi:hypothetical protein
MEGQLILAKVEDYLQRANQGAPGMDEAVIQEAGERFKDILRRTFNESRSGNFRIYMSNAGKPSCQLTMERNGAPKEPQTAAFRFKMLMGDASEIILRAVLKGSGVTIDASNVKVTLPLFPGIDVRGEYDFKINGRIWDAKSASRWSFENKWANGFSHIEQYDDFGYCGQLYGYAEADKAKVGGFIVVCKETGKLAAVEAIDTIEYRTKHLNRLKENVVKVLDTERPFERNFSDVAETFYGKPTGNRTLGITCGFCEFKYSCWPGLQRKNQAQSQAVNKKMIHYTVYDEANNQPQRQTDKVQKPKRARNRKTETV